MLETRIHVTNLVTPSLLEPECGACAFTSELIEGDPVYATRTKEIPNVLAASLDTYEVTESSVVVLRGVCEAPEFIKWYKT